MNKTVSIVLFLLVVMPLEAAETEQYDVVRQVGQLNGLALNCRYFTEVKRIKKALVKALPKKRDFGKVFEDATNDAFLAFIESGKSCPSAEEFAAQVDDGIELLNKTFTSDKP